ncbi:unnamed protein product [Cylindrotheca closterium]|uniref:CCHC-type domain-containing protein n=1 Tax=Cylindrotheca closterium TaxID=2856 RepID=A0AAD2JMF8_9STRA|nr:unnamed protein product [Cylindrotheca closterium]
MLACMNAAKEALNIEEESEKTPSIRCWGCQKIGHSFRECPHKGDPGVISQFEKSLEDYRLKREQRRHKSDITSYKDSGYINQIIYETIQKIEHPETREDEQRTLLINLAKTITEHMGNNSGQKRKQRRTDPPLTFMTVRSFAATEQAQKLDFPVNKVLAVIHFPIGLNRGYTANLKGIYNTGGCCNIGEKAYHLAIAKQHPQLVKQVYNFPKIHCAPIKIGGIKDSVNIEAIIEYYIPFASEDGENHTLMFGLTEQLPVNTLLPF